MSSLLSQLGSLAADALSWIESDFDVYSDGFYNYTFMTDEIAEGLFNVTLSEPGAAFLYPFEFENEFHSGGDWSLFARSYQVAPIVCCVVYLAVVFGLKAFMKDRPAVRIRVPWIWWNILLSAFSWFGTIRMVPHLALLVRDKGFGYSYCAPSAQSYGWGQASGLWTGLFIFSKIPELFDTLFIVLMKADLHFLQWYHHITVLLYTWHSYATRSGAGVWFIAMNYSVHAVMYMYFALMLTSSERKSRAYQLTDPAAQERALASVKRFRGGLRGFAPLITVMQISQMAVGVTIMVLIINESNYFYGDRICYVRRSSVVYGLAMYFSYLCLFVHFAIRKYCCKGKEKSVQDEKHAKAEAPGAAAGVGKRKVE